MAKQKRGGSVGDAPKNANDITSDLTGNGTYKGPVSNVTGMHRLLMREPAKYHQEQPKSYFLYVSAEKVDKIRAKYEKNFVRDLGVVKSDVRPKAKSAIVSYAL